MKSPDPDLSQPDGTPLTWSHAAHEIPQGGLSQQRTATDAERAAVANELGVLDCLRLDARYDIRALAAGRYMLSGSLRADVVQSCVVTLEPVTATVNEAFAVEFYPPGENVEGSAGDIDPFETVDIEPLLHGRIPVGRVVYEQLASGLDPYPRAEGAQLEWSEPKGEEGAAQSPFDVLKQLRPKT
jgi:uncharacterized metal-binding protein YceD (DUF177 family)